MSVTLTGPPRHDFEVHLDVYDGPFDVLLGLIGKHTLDVTEVALAQVTDEFVAYARAGGFDLEQATSFLVVAATLLDLKAARLLPGVEAADEEDLALLEARDLLFARLLQYRAYKQVAAWLAEAMTDEARWVPRTAALPPDLAAVLPRVVLGTDVTGLAILAAAALAPRAPELVDVTHVHMTRVNVAEHAAAISERLIEVGSASFRALCRDCRELIEVVARFLAVLELIRDGRVRVEQVAPLGDLQVTWSASASGVASASTPAAAGSAPARAWRAAMQPAAADSTIGTARRVEPAPCSVVDLAALGRRGPELGTPRPDGRTDGP